jgi:hypothetical protein
MPNAWRARTHLLGLLALTLWACGGGGAASGPSAAPGATPTPPAGTFSVVSSSPAFAGTVSGPSNDLAGTTGLSVTIQTSSSSAIPSAYFVVELLDGATECLRTGIYYCDRTDGGTAGTYVAGEPATYRCTFFVRDNQQPSCGARFTTNRIRFILQSRPSLETVFTQEVTGGWSFVFPG